MLELWLLLCTTDLNLSKPEQSILCLASVEAESSLLGESSSPSAFSQTLKAN